MPLDSEFWSNEEDDLNGALFPLILAAALNAAQNAAEGLVAEAGVGVDWGLVNQAAVGWARDYTYSLVKGITDTTRDFLRDEIRAWIESGQPLDVLRDTLAPMFGDVRAAMIAETEVTRAFASGNLITWQESGIVEGVRWQTANDELVCPICEPLNQTVTPLASPVEPPAHVRCRCWITPVIMQAQ